MLVQHFAYRGIRIGSWTLLVIQLKWFGYVARLSQWGGGGYCTCSNDDYLPRGRGGGVSILWVWRRIQGENDELKKMFSAQVTYPYMTLLV